MYNEKGLIVPLYKAIVKDDMTALMQHNSY